MKIEKTRLALLATLSLGGCWSDPVIKAQNEQEFRASYETIARRLSPAEQAEFDGALKDIVLVETRLFRPIAEAEQGSGAVKNGLSGVFMNAAYSAIEEDWSRARAQSVVKNAGSIVDWHTVREIQSLAGAERRQGYEIAMSLRREQRAQLISRIRGEKTGLQEEQANQEQVVDYLRHLSVTNAIFSYVENMFIKEPSVSFTIANTATWPISEVKFHAKVQTPSRTIPWAEGDFTYKFPGGLEGGERKSLKLTLNLYSKWAEVPNEAIPGCVLTLIPVAFVDSAGVTFAATSTVASKTTRLEALQKELSGLDDTIKQLEQLAQSGT